MLYDNGKQQILLHQKFVYLIGYIQFKRLGEIDQDELCDCLHINIVYLYILFKQ